MYSVTRGVGTGRGDRGAARDAPPPHTRTKSRLTGGAGWCAARLVSALHPPTNVTGAMERYHVPPTPPPFQLRHAPTPLSVTWGLQLL